MNILSRSKWHQVLGSQVLIVHMGMGNSMDTHTMILRMSISSHSSIYAQPQQYGGYSGPSHGYGQQQNGIFVVPVSPQMQQPPPYANPQLQVMAPSSNYGDGSITPRAGQGFFHFDFAQYVRQSQNNDDMKI